MDRRPWLIILSFQCQPHCYAYPVNHRITAGSIAALCAYDTEDKWVKKTAASGKSHVDTYFVLEKQTIYRVSQITVSSRTIFYVAEFSAVHDDIENALNDCDYCKLVV